MTCLLEGLVGKVYFKLMLVILYDVMKPRRILRIILIVLLAITGIIAVLSAARYHLILIGNPFSVYSALYILGVLAGIAILVFVLTIIKDLLKHRAISKQVYVISIVFSSIVMVMIALLGYGLIRDALGVYCAGFFGAQSSCTLGPLLMIYMVLFQPIPFIVAGLVASYGIYNQLKLREQTKPKPKPKA